MHCGRDRKFVREIKTASEPEALVRHFDELELSASHIGLEARPLSQWLHAGLVAAGCDVVLLETRYVKAALSAITVRTDVRCARRRPPAADGMVAPGSCQVGDSQGYGCSNCRIFDYVGHATQRYQRISLF